MSRDIVILGCGAFARDVLWLLHEQNKAGAGWNILGFVGQSDAGRIHGYPVLGGDEWLLNYDSPICAALAVANPALKMRIAGQFEAKANVSFPPLVATTAQTGLNVEIGRGTIVCADSILPVDCEIGSFVTVNLGCIVEHDAVLGDYVTLAPRVAVCGHAVIEEGAEIGVGANIIQGIRIGAGSVIGAGAAVIRDIPPGCTAVGVPARPLPQKTDRTETQ